MANENMRMSATGYGALQFSEGVVMRYYNDSPRNGNCTWDIGSLAQHFMNNVYIHPRDAHGHVVGPRQLSAGLLNRRRRESAPFLQGNP